MNGTLEIVRLLGEGGFGEVYQATLRQPSGLSKSVALKVLREGLDPAGQAVLRLRDEAAMLAMLRHPAVLHVYDVLEVRGRVAMLCEFVDGIDLYEASRSDMSPRSVVQTVGECADALDVAWRELRLIHRDIKPQNVMVTRYGAVRLLDFGIASATGMEREARTQTGMMIGSPGYMAPERFLDDVEEGPASDVYSLGVLLWESLVLRSLFDKRRFSTIGKVYGVMADRQKHDALIDEAAKHLESLPLGIGKHQVCEIFRLCTSWKASARPSSLQIAQLCSRVSDLQSVQQDPLREWARISYETSPVPPEDMQKGWCGEVVRI